jgi:hypothetical protein
MAFNANVRSASTSSGSESIGRATRQAQHIAGDLPGQNSHLVTAKCCGHLDHLLSAKAKVRKVEHHAALPYARIGTFLAALRKQNGIAARALEFVHAAAKPVHESFDRGLGLECALSDASESGRRSRPPGNT